jgi:hypothetical protein
MYITKRNREKENKDPGGSRTARRVPPVDPPRATGGPPPFDDKRRASARERKRRSRDRRARGRIIFNVEADEFSVIDTLILSGRLSEDEASQRHKVEKALGAMVGDWLERWRVKTRDA